MDAHRMAAGAAMVVFGGTGAATPRVDVRPPVVVLGQQASVTVSGWNAPELDVRLVGAADAQGRLLGWRAAQRVGATWTVALPRPVLRGIYPVQLRTGDGGTMWSPRWLLRVFRSGAGSEPSFPEPRAVVRWWTRNVQHATLAAVRPWPLPAFDRRDRRLHRLFVVAFNLPGHAGVAERLGMFVTVVRDGYAGRWRLLEATVKPQ
jgi:hypothetical protein